MKQTRYYTISEAARILGKAGNRKLIRKLIRILKLETTTIGKSICIDHRGFRVLTKAVSEWDARLRISELATAG